MSALVINDGDTGEAISQLHAQTGEIRLIYPCINGRHAELHLVPLTSFDKSIVSVEIDIRAKQLKLKFKAAGVTELIFASKQAPNLSAIVKIKVSEPEAVTKSESGPQEALRSLDLDLYDQLLIAKSATSSFDFEKVKDVSEFIDGKGELNEVIRNLHERTTSKYTSLLNDYLKKNNIDRVKVSEESFNIQIDQCMKAGLRNLYKRHSYPDTTAKGSTENSAAQIEKTHSWDELKDKF